MSADYPRSDVQGKGGGMNLCPDLQLSCERRELLHGFEVVSWYNEYHCNWEAWIKGIGGWIDSENRENAIVGILRKAWREKEAEK